jgi:tryptophan halogenase
MKLTIVGGGTAGWLTALLFNRKHPEYNITVIESSKIGILGAGEGTTPNFQGILYSLGIGELEFIKRTSSTIKDANKFVNWSPSESSFLHDFKDPNHTKLQQDMIHGLHFDARLVAQYFKEIGISRGINYLDANITSFSQKENGDIITIHTEEGIDVHPDFIIDCSGFARLIIGKLYKSNWKSYSEYLNANEAIAFFLPQKNDLKFTKKTQTQSIAMKSGWMWQAPLQHRWGCGYVYDNKFISSEEAKNEVEQYIGQEIEIVKKFNFNAGSYESTWINNCVSLGLASGFLEPLEATSLMTLIISVHTLIEMGITDNNNIEKYNETVRDINYQCMLFVKHHYMCGRKDTPFWESNFNSKLPEGLRDLYNVGLNNIKTDEELLKLLNVKSDKMVFGLNNYTIVNLGHTNKTKKTLI